MRDRIAQTKKLAVVEGMIWNGFFMGTQGFVLTSLALYFNASPLVLAILSALPLTAQIFQVFGMQAYKVLKTRRRIFVVSSILSRSAFVFLPIAILAKANKSFVLLAVLGCYSLFGTFVNNSWMAAMKSIISQEERGRYFGKRSIFVSFASMGFVYLYGYLLKNNTPERGVLLVSSCMAVTAVITIILYMKHYIPDLEKEAKQVTDIFHPLKDHNFRKYLIYIVFWIFSMEFVKPFFSYYQIQILNVDKQFLGLMAVVTGTISMLIFMSIGKMADKFGNRLILILGMFISTYNLLLYMFMSPENYKLLLIMDSVFNAFAFSAINLAFLNLLLEVTKEPAESYTALYSVVFGITALSASIIGGLIGNLVQNVEFNVFGEMYDGIKIIFLIAFIVRIFAMLHLTNVEAYLQPLKFENMVPTVNMDWRNLLRGIRRRKIK